MTILYSPTFDVKGLPKAGPLDGGARPQFCNESTQVWICSLQRYFGEWKPTNA